MNLGAPASLDAWYLRNLKLQLHWCHCSWVLSWVSTLGPIATLSNSSWAGRRLLFHSLGDSFSWKGNSQLLGWTETIVFLRLGRNFSAGIILGGTKYLSASIPFDATPGSTDIRGALQIALGTGVGSVCGALVGGLKLMALLLWSWGAYCCSGNIGCCSLLFVVRVLIVAIFWWTDSLSVTITKPHKPVK